MSVPASSASAGSVVIHSVTLVSGGVETPDSWVEFSGGKISARGTGGTWRSDNGADNASEVVDGTGRFLTPGFIDIHGHGGGGFSYDTNAADIEKALATHRARGTTRQVLSLVANPIPQLLDQLTMIRGAMAHVPGVLGAHLEGPFLEIVHKGAHDARWLSNPDPESVKTLLAASDGVVRQITIAPELPGALEAIEGFARAGIAVAVGHTGANYALTLEAFRRGASILTHAFNAMEPILHRAPGPIVAAVDSSSVTIEVICDGVHVHPSVVRMLVDSAPERIALITDSMAAAGAADGEYLLGSLPVYVVDGVARLDSGQIAGSTLTLERAIQVAVNQVGLPLAQAVDAATRFPARALGIEDTFGTLELGKAADAVLLGKHLGVKRVWMDGVAC